MSLDPGELRERLTFSARTEVKNPDNGEVTETFARISSTPTVAAKWMPLRAGEAERASTTTATAQGKFIIRHRDDLDTTMRASVTRGGRATTYAITGIEPWGREYRTWLAVFVSEIVGG